MSVSLAQHYVDDVRRELERHRRTEARAEAQALDPTSTRDEVVKARAQAARAARDAVAAQQKVYAAEAKLDDELRRAALKENARSRPPEPAGSEPDDVT